ncbi:hypothetical protein DAETH_03040 [Deinococcus aetherius]|uniref:Uncharacterized protein n=1 Tax=Deinococcus aetherius TaxID=200252 RepID=A0ABN6RBY1_9DEIO|nr:hypothetical protein [Deinococcus aetherius]BDP40335.1 hypothetical protein DAETH_03040 [Deinococcus aetherius]
MTSDDDRDALPVNPTLAVRSEPQTDDQTAEQGDAPAGFATRPASGVPTPSGDHLNAAEVTALLGGGGEDEVETTHTLKRAEGLNPDTES